MTWRERLDQARSRREAMSILIESFRVAGVDDPATDARLLLCAAAEIDHAALIRDPDTELEEDARVRLSAFANRRVAREPVTRILGSRGFWSLDIEVGAGVLDPRPDSETVIDAALRAFADRQAEPLRIADLGSGSGALICALLDVFGRATGVAVDLSSQARRLTERNLRACGILSRARVIEGDWAILKGEAFDLVVSNPPYIRSGDIASLDAEVRDYDPRLALDGGADGLDAYRSLADLLPGLLSTHGRAIVEMGAGQVAGIADVMRAGGLEIEAVQSDLSGIERAMILRNRAAVARS